MRFLARLTALVCLATASALAQTATGGDLAATYHWVRVNTQPGNCGCFSLGGGSISASKNIAPRWAVVAEGSVEHASNVLSNGDSLTFSSGMAGGRYRFLSVETHPIFQPFAQVLVGLTHASGTLAGLGNGGTGLSARMGAGFDMPMSRNFSFRVLQLDYYATTFNNGQNNHQNNLLLASGLVLRWPRVTPAPTPFGTPIMHRSIHLFGIGAGK